jgi:hypothetical protein
MKDGDVAGLALLRHLSAYIAVKKSGGTAKLTMVNGLMMDGSWNATSTGTEAASADVTGTTVWLRLDADIRQGSGRQGKFSYSTDGTTFTALGPAYTMNNSWEFFQGLPLRHLQFRDGCDRRRRHRQVVHAGDAVGHSPGPAATEA